MDLTSTAFAKGAEIPRRYTCEGDDTPPPLSWSGVSPLAKSLALIVDDPDAPDPAAPQRTWVHWVLFDMPPGATGLPEGGQPATRARAKASTTGSALATAARARRSAAIAISSSCSRSTRSCPT